MGSSDRTPKKGSMLSMSEAARRAGVSRSTLYRKLKDGSLSASRGPDGSKGIDSAELKRVFHDTLRETVSDTSRRDIQRETAGQVAVLQAELEGLRRQVALLERTLAEANNEKSRLLSIVEQRALAGPGAPAQSWWKRLTGG